VSELPKPYVSDYVGMDIRLAVNLTKMIQLSVVGQNLIKDHHTEFIPDNPPTKDVERSVYGKIVCRF
jgi:hypothetical protein